MQCRYIYIPWLNYIAEFLNKDTLQYIVDMMYIVLLLGPSLNCAAFSHKHFCAQCIISYCTSLYCLTVFIFCVCVFSSTHQVMRVKTNWGRTGEVRVCFPAERERLLVVGYSTRDSGFWSYVCCNSPEVVGGSSGCRFKVHQGHVTSSDLIERRGQLPWVTQTHRRLGVT